MCMPYLLLTYQIQTYQRLENDAPYKGKGGGKGKGAKGKLGKPPLGHDPTRKRRVPPAMLHC